MSQIKSQLQPSQIVVLQLPAAMVAKVGELLSTHPFREVADIIGALHQAMQGAAQQQPPVPDGDTPSF